MSESSLEGTWLPYRRAAQAARLEAWQLQMLEPAGFRAQSDHFQSARGRDFVSPAGVRVLAAFVKQRGYPTKAMQLEALAHSYEVESRQQAATPSRGLITAPAPKSSELRHYAWQDRKDTNG